MIFHDNTVRWYHKNLTAEYLCPESDDLQRKYLEKSCQNFSLITSSRTKQRQNHTRITPRGLMFKTDNLFEAKTELWPFYHLASRCADFRSTPRQTEDEPDKTITGNP